MHGNVKNTIFLSNSTKILTINNSNHVKQTQDITLFMYLVILARAYIILLPFLRISNLLSKHFSTSEYRRYKLNLWLSFKTQCYPPNIFFRLYM